MNSPEFPDFAGFNEQIPEFSEEPIQLDALYIGVAGSVPAYYVGTMKYSNWSIQRLKNPNLPPYPPTHFD